MPHGSQSYDIGRDERGPRPPVSSRQQLCERGDEFPMKALRHEMGDNHQ